MKELFFGGLQKDNGWFISCLRNKIVNHKYLRSGLNGKVRIEGDERIRVKCRVD